jgi:hypothetical protein
VPYMLCGFWLSAIRYRRHQGFIAVPEISSNL